MDKEQVIEKSKVKIIKTGEIVDVYFRHGDGIAYVGKHGIVILSKGQYQEVY